MPLWIRVSCQVIPGPKLQVYLGCATFENTVSELTGSVDKYFLLIFLEKFSVPFLPFKTTAMKLGKGPICFLIDYMDGLASSEVTSHCPARPEEQDQDLDKRVVC